MVPTSPLGEFDQLVLLVVHRLGERAYGPSVSRELEQGGTRSISRGALYSSLDRLERNGHLEWTLEAPTTRRAGHRRRRFLVTQRGVQALAESGDADLSHREPGDKAQHVTTTLPR